MFYFPQLPMCVREVKFASTGYGKEAPPIPSMFLFSQFIMRILVQNEAPATLVMPFKAENEITEKESHNPQWTERGFQPNSSSIPPSNNTQSHQPLTLKRHKTQRVEEKLPPRLRGWPSQETKEKTESMKKWRTHKILVLTIIKNNYII